MPPQLLFLDFFETPLVCDDSTGYNSNGHESLRRRRPIFQIGPEYISNLLSLTSTSTPPRKADICVLSSRQRAAVFNLTACSWRDFLRVALVSQVTGKGKPKPASHSPLAPCASRPGCRRQPPRSGPSPHPAGKTAASVVSLPTNPLRPQQRSPRETHSP